MIKCFPLPIRHWVTVESVTEGLLLLLYSYHWPPQSSTPRPSAARKQMPYINIKQWRKIKTQWVRSPCIRHHLYAGITLTWPLFLINRKTWCILRYTVSSCGQTNRRKQNYSCPLNQERHTLLLWMKWLGYRSHMH